MLNFSFGTYWDVNIKQLCSSNVYKHNLSIWSCLGDLMRCILSFNFGLRISTSKVLLERYNLACLFLFKT